MQIKKQAKVYDVVVIGSGASGGMAAWNLTRQGVNVLLLDAGDRFDPANFWMALLPYERREKLRRGERPPQFFLSAKEQPVLSPPDNPYTLYRVWGHGGKTNIWGRVSLRYSDLDFKVNDGYGIPWPFEAVAWRASDYLAGEIRKGNLGNDDRKLAASPAFPRPTI